ncbi:hypothetical protein Plhal304r1_c011g0041601 [Plasmopara halstedii]
MRIVRSLRCRHVKFVVPTPYVQVLLKIAVGLFPSAGLRRYEVFPNYICLHLMLLRQRWFAIGIGNQVSCKLHLHNI